MEDSKKYIHELVKRTSFDVSQINNNDFISNHEIFTGTPKRSSSDSTKLLLITNPFSELSPIYEFSIKSISHVEEVGTISSPDSKTALKVKVWIKKGSVAIETRPFQV
jgi:hypothetical protein